MTGSVLGKQNSVEVREGNFLYAPFGFQKIGGEGNFLFFFKISKIRGKMIYKKFFKEF